MQNLQHDGWPLPAVTIGQDFTILEQSPEAARLFGPASSLLDLLDEESRPKARDFLYSNKTGQRTELNIIGAKGERMTADVYAKWNGGEAVVVFVPTDDSLRRISDQFTALRRRLNETNYDLLLEKMKVDELVERVQELSAPFIRLDRTRVLVPLFGDLTSDQMAAVQSRVLQDTYSASATEILLDFTAVDEIDRSGLQALDSLLQSLSLMGTDVTLTGLHPEHAQRLHELDARLGTRFASSLKDVL
ncbi:STAS domain-containing protein [Indiicoccus explosivorum]|uniref:STAS domain-containing protein n=1 Tax=Indiicoccus explosivorum TaxID=1917864 RepID=UPI000B43322C|nr:STAS domain-containing protein [Indiicoccus explosivorum]